MSRLTGIFTPNLVPLDQRGEINESELRRYVDWLIDRGVHGLYPNGSTGEFTRFTVEDRRRIVEIIAAQVDGRVPILAGAAEATVRETVAACEYYHELGVRAVAIVAPFYYRLGPEAVYAYFRELARITPVEVALYDLGGRLVRKLVERRATSTGEYEIAWNGADASGARVPPGIYYAWLKVAAAAGGLEADRTRVLRTVAVAY